MDAKHNLINLRGLLLGNPSRLRFTVRFSNCPRIHDENVAEHSYYVALYALWIARAVHESINTPPFGLNIGEVVSRALMHDVDECYSGDFIRMFKHHNHRVKDAINETCRSLMMDFAFELSDDAAMRETVYNTWDFSKVGMEGAIVSFADYLSVLSYIWQEIDSGNHRMRQQIPELRRFHLTFRAKNFNFLEDFVDAAEKILNEIEKENKSHGV